jgi:hypothetical protein
MPDGFALHLCEVRVAVPGTGPAFVLADRLAGDQVWKGSLIARDEDKAEQYSLLSVLVCDGVKPHLQQVQL